MKQPICILLALLMLALCGCQEEAPSYQDPIRLYFRTAEEKGDIPTEVIGWQLAEGHGRRQDPKALLNEYLRTPPGHGFYQTFPSFSQIVTFEIDHGKVFLTLNNSFAGYDGIRLTLACACLAKTVMDLTGAEAVYMKAQGSTLGGSEQIMMDAQTLVTLDLLSETT